MEFPITEFQVTLNDPPLRVQSLRRYLPVYLRWSHEPMQWSTKCLGLSGSCEDLFALISVDGYMLGDGQRPVGQSQEGGTVGTKAFG